MSKFKEYLNHINETVVLEGVEGLRRWLQRCNLVNSHREERENVRSTINFIKDEIKKGTLTKDVAIETVISSKNWGLYGDMIVNAILKEIQ